MPEKIYQIILQPPIWGYTLSIALLIAAIISPILGALADFRGSKKRYLGYFVVLGVTGTALLYFVGEGEWLKASLFFIIGNVGFAAANVFYDSLLPHIAKPEEVDRVSAKRKLYYCLRLDKVIVDCS